ncbi:MAG: hypothetical protein KDK29_02765, partial [Sedimentitalea sp.]|nr:hypothetical protein [Sedimentitalea sp.]
DFFSGLLEQEWRGGTFRLNAQRIEPDARNGTIALVSRRRRAGGSDARDPGLRFQVTPRARGPERRVAQQVAVRFPGLAGARDPAQDGGDRVQT